eukprot:7379599-Prymnesium_polylepis.1
MLLPTKPRRINYPGPPGTCIPLSLIRAAATRSGHRPTQTLARPIDAVPCDNPGPRDYGRGARHHGGWRCCRCLDKVDQEGALRGFDRDPRDGDDV